MPDNKYLTIQVDLDGLWTIQKFLGKDAPVDPDPIFANSLPRVLDLFSEAGIKATFFVSAKDLQCNSKLLLLQKIIQAGHEIASHGVGHRYLTILDRAQVAWEVAESKKNIESALGVKVYGFKAPGFAVTGDLASMLEDAGYDYDSSVFGTICAPFMEMISKAPYPKLAMMTAITKPYMASANNIFKRGDSRIMEIPVTPAPFLRTPAHFSYLLMAGNMYTKIVRWLISTRDPMCINYLFHLLDFVDNSDVQIEGGIPGLSIGAAIKIKMAGGMLSFLKKGRKIVTTGALRGIIKSDEGVSA